MFSGGLRKAWELGSIGLVAVGVALVSTVAGSVLDHIHQVDAEDLAAHEVKAVAGAGGMQTVDLTDWGVRFETPLAAEMPLMRYAVSGRQSSVGLSTADLEQVGPQCRASRNGLGTLLRLPAGSFVDFSRGDGRYEYVKTLGGYDYAYQRPENECSYDVVAAGIINREMAVLTEALSTLTLASN